MVECQYFAVCVDLTRILQCCDVHLQKHGKREETSWCPPLPECYKDPQRLLLSFSPLWQQVWYIGFRE